MMDRRSGVVNGIVTAALASFRRGEIGERELIAILLSANETLSDLLKDTGYSGFAVEAARGLRERIVELDHAI